MVVETLLNPILSPLLELSPVWSIMIISFVVAAFATVVYYYTTDQDKLRYLKKEMKELQAKMKKVSKEDPGKAMSLNKKMMSLSKDQIVITMKSTLYTMLPLLLVLWWMMSNLAYYPIIPNQNFSVSAYMAEGINGELSLNAPDGITLISNPVQPIIDSKASWFLSGKEGEYFIEFTHNNENQQIELIISDKAGHYSEPQKRFASLFSKESNNFNMIQINNKEIKPFGQLSIFGWRPGWLATYIFFSLLFNLGLKKIFNIA